MRDTKVKKNLVIGAKAMTIALIVTVLDNLWCSDRLAVVKAVAAYYGWTVTS